MKPVLSPSFIPYALLSLFALGLIAGADTRASAQAGTSPVVQAFNFTPQQVDVSTQNATVTFTMHVTDPSGVKSVYVHLSNSSYGASVEVYDSAASPAVTSTLTSGTLQDAYLTANLTVYGGSVPGKWTVDNVYVQDIAGNVINLATTDLTNAGMPSVLTVIDNPAAPKLTGFSFSPSVVDVTNSSQTVTFNVSARDLNSADGYGIAYVLVSFMAPPTCRGPEADTILVYSPSSGSSGNGVWTGHVTLSQDEIVGNWSAYVEVHDTSGTYIVYQAADLQKLGFQAYLTVTGPPNCGNTESPFTTFTQGGWHAAPHGMNPGYYLTKYFPTVCPNGITIGDTAGSFFTFTSAAAIEAFLPQGGNSVPLPIGEMTNPTGKFGNITGQLLAVKLAVAFSNGAIFHSGLGSLTIQSGPLAGKTVDYVVALADGMLGGTVTPPPGITFSAVDSVLDSINSSFDGGATSTGYIK